MIHNLPDQKLETARKKKANLHRVLQMSERHGKKLQALGFL